MGVTVGGADTAADSALNRTKSKHVPHTYLTLPDGKKIMFSLPTKTGNTGNTGNYGERLKHNSTTEAPLKKAPSRGHGFTQRGIKFLILSVLCCLIGILFYLLAVDD